MQLIKKRDIAINGQSQTTFEIPNSTIATIASIVAIVQTLVTILANLLTGLSATHSNNLVDKLEEKNFQVQLFQRVLEIDDPKARANSIRLLISADLLKDPDGKISKTITDSTVPKWITRPLETFDAKRITTNLKIQTDGSPNSENQKKDSTSN